MKRTKVKNRRRRSSNSVALRKADSKAVRSINIAAGKRPAHSSKEFYAKGKSVAPPMAPASFRDGSGSETYRKKAIIPGIRVRKSRPGSGSESGGRVK